MKTISRLLALLILPVVASAEGPRGYYRFPAIHQDTIVFTAEGDLWQVSVSGGLAQRLTTHPGSESHAAISPDGKTLAFTAEYEGPREVYTMPLAGGLPRRQTFEGGQTTVVGWSPAGEVLYSTERYSTLPSWQLAAVDVKTGTPRLLPLAQASHGVFDPEGKVLFFTRFSKQGSSTKRYQGGWVENLWRFEEGAPEAVPLTADFKGTSRNPMWWDGRLYFASDRDGIVNLWSMKPEGSDLKQLTAHREYDVKSPSLHCGRIVYQHGADLRIFDVISGKDAELDIRVASDFDQQRERWVKKPMEYLTSAHISPTGDRLALTARGQVFVAPVEQGRFVEVPRQPVVRYRNARFLPDGKSLVALSDQSGELEFWNLPANGVGVPIAVTTNGTRFRFAGVPSPNGKRLAWTDKDRKLWIHQMDSGVTTLVAEADRDMIEQFNWSPDSQWLAYVDLATNWMQQIHLYRVSDGIHSVVTSDRVDSFNPAWSPDGKWLYFLSDRELRSLVTSPWGPRQPEPHFTETTKIYALALQAKERWPFAQKDELQPEEKEKKEDDKVKKTGEEAENEKKDRVDKDEDEAKTSDSASGKKSSVAVTVEIDLEGLPSRLFEVPVPAGNYRQLEILRKHLIWVAREVGYKAESHLKQLEVTHKDPKPKTLVENLESFELSGDLKKLLVRKSGAFYVIAADASAPAKLEDKVNLDRWTFSIIPREEWQQIYTEAWRMMRDYFYDRQMHGIDWPKMHAKYLPLLDRVSDRAELGDVIAELVGELSTLHVFVRYGDLRESPDQIETASLGARLVRDENLGGWRIEHIFRCDPDYPDRLSPLARPEVNARRGDVVTAINGRATLSVPHLAVLLRNQVGKQVLLEIKPADGAVPRKAIVYPVSANGEENLRYEEWELSRRERVEELGRGQIGYVHLRSMGAGDMAQWVRDYFPVFNRQGLIIDVRNNRGGNIDSWILSRLLRRAWFYWQPNVGEPYWNMQKAFRGHITVLCNERTASDGEAFSEGFRRLGLGKVIGTRTWGGEIWLSSQRWLVDSGMATAAEIGVYGPEGEWLIEGHGVDPDIFVDNLPHTTFKGQDAQLEAAVKHLQALIEVDPRPVTPRPKYPNKSFRPGGL